MALSQWCCAGHCSTDLGLKSVSALAVQTPKILAYEVTVNES